MSKIISKINMHQSSDNLSTVHRLYELGFRPGLEVEIHSRIFLGGVTVLSLNMGSSQVLMALNEEEMSCLELVDQAEVIRG